MACPVNKKTILDDVKKEIVNNATSYIVTDTEIRIPVGERIKSKEATLKVAQKLSEKVNIKYNGEVFGNVTSLNTTYKDSTGINIHIPNKLVTAYEVKNGEKTTEEFERDIEYFMGDQALLEQEERDNLYEEWYKDNYDGIATHEEMRAYFKKCNNGFKVFKYI